MDKKKLIYFALGTLVLLPSCSQDEPSKRELRGDDTPIYFRSYLPSVTQSRAAVINENNFTSCQVTCFNPDDADSDDGTLMPYFTDISFNKNEEGNFVAREEDGIYWPRASNKLHFFAYYPSVASMKETVGADFFNLDNASTHSDGKAIIDYHIKKFIVAPEISSQVDFITAYASASLSENGNTGIALNFKHQLARVEISAWGANDKYDYEIAGVRIGNPLTQGDFNLSGLMTDNTQTHFWENTGAQSVVQHIFNPGETIALVGGGNHESENDAVSVMGTAGPAMVIPMTSRIEAWEGKNDPAIAN
ncbi:MAG: fimbrillin family protein, partial [Muribaculaceae bacterium]|nr:fimbrillin family protein [Muribaculaceae bacterium]